MASTMVHTQSPKAMENLGFGSPFGSSRRSRLSLVDTWVSLPTLRPVRTAATTITTSVTGSSGTPKSTVKSSLSLDIPTLGEDFVREVGCETPKDIDHKIPDVDVEICPPAPKKARGMSRMALACSSASVGHDFGLSPAYLF